MHSIYLLEHQVLSVVIVCCKLQSYINFHFLGLLSTTTSPLGLRTMFTELVELGGLVQLGCHTPFSLSRTGNMQLTWLNCWRELISMCP
jgi:hypothetical protein